MKKLRWPTKYQWAHFFAVLSKKEKALLLFFVLLTIASAIFLGVGFYHKKTELVPAFGGKFVEGLVGTPRFINPILAQTSETDRDITNLVFAGLMKNKGGKLVNDAAKDYAIGEEGRVYDFFLKENAFWHDGHQLSADDVIFTIQTIQNQDYKSPLRTNWQGVEVEKIDNLTVRFRLKNPYAPFLNNLTLGILPKHIWEQISPAKFALSDFNLAPVGNGPYKLKSVKRTEDQVKFIELEAHKQYYAHSPYIKSIKLLFFEDEAQALAALNGGKINSLSLTPSDSLSQLYLYLGLKKYSFYLPRYFALFFNQSKNKILAEEAVRQAIAYSINKGQIINEILKGEALPVDSAILPFIFGHAKEIDIYNFAPEHAEGLLEAAGWQDKNGDGIKEKEDQPLQLTINLPDWPELTKIADFIKKQLEEIGFKVELDIKEPKIIQKEVIKPREYQALIFGEALGIEPDPFAFWHSSQMKDPGLNLALYQNKNVDSLLEQARQDLNPESRLKKLADFQTILAKDLPAVFLYSPSFIYVADKKVKNITAQLINVPSERFNDIENWYIKTKRKWK